MILLNGDLLPYPNRAPFKLSQIFFYYVVVNPAGGKLAVLVGPPEDCFSTLYIPYDAVTPCSPRLAVTFPVSTLLSHPHIRRQLSDHQEITL